MNRADLVKLVDPRAEEFEPITLTKLQGLLAFEKAVRFATLITRTPVEMRKLNNPYHGNAFKIARTNFMVHPPTDSYAKKVNAQRVREGGIGDFLAGPRKWGTRLTGIPFVSHINKEGVAKLYLEVYNRQDFRKIYQDGAGNPLDFSLLQPYIPARKPSTHQGIKKEIKIRDFSVENIIGCCIDKKRYIIEG